MPASVFTVKAKENSISGGVPLNTGISVQPGQLMVVSVDPRDVWAAGVGDRTSNANGLGNPYGGNYGMYTRGAQSFLYGALVGSIDGGHTFFGIGTNLTMTIVTSGTLTLHYWDADNQDNTGQVRVIVALYSGPSNVK